MHDYVELFDERGGIYDRAMQAYPAARDEEFIQLLARCELQAGHIIADVPAGGGYLKKYLPENCILWEHEPSSHFRAGLNKGGPLFPFPWDNDSVNTAVSLAGVHHLLDKRPFFKELFRVVKPGGRLVLSDVAANSAVANFLDGYVGDNNSTGHKGIYLSKDTPNELCQVGWHLISAEQVDFNWVFNDLLAMGRFCHSLFDLQHVSFRNTIDVIRAKLGIDILDGGKIGMHWSLMTIVVERRN